MNRRLSLLCLIIGLVYSQNVDECYPTDNIPHTREAELADSVDLRLNITDLENYIDLCNNDGEEPSLSSLIRRTSERCTEFSIDNGDRECKAEPSVRYGFSEEEKKCIRFDYTGCGGNENNFETIEECEAVCVDPCTLQPNVGTSSEVHTTKEGEKQEVSCRERSGTYYAYKPSRRTCSRLEYQGCGGNQNRFESERECADICGARVVTEPSRPDILPDRVEADRHVLSRGRRDVDEEGQQENDSDRPAFCRKFEQTYPDAAQIVKTLDKTTSKDIDAELIEELEAQIAEDSEQTSSKNRQRRALLGLLTRPLKHTSVRILRNDNCRRIDITIRIKCLRAVWNRPTEEQAAKLCELVKQGIKKHWEVDILDNAGNVDYPVTVTVKESLLLSKKVVLKWYSSSPSNTNLLRSFNLGWWWIPMWMKYRGYAAGGNEDLNFMETAAHEFGHDVLMASGGLVWSWGHEGTSTIFGNTVPATPARPNNPAPINLMWYSVGGDLTNYYNRVQASQDQMKALVNYATFRFRPWWCPGAVGSPCLLNSQCHPPGICSWFRCVLCNQDTQCAANQYCKGRFNPFIVNHCFPRKANGQLCSRDAMCQSGMCDGGQCVECEDDHHCGTNEYCNNKDLPYILNQCTAKKPNGALCLQDRVCLSGMCDGGQCVECENDGHCSASQWCKNKDFPLILNDCVNKLGNGAWCVRDAQCSSGMCDGLRCVECEHDWQCPTNQWCKNKNFPFILNDCVGKKCTGWCTHGNQCQSGVCRWYGRCKKC